MELNKNSTPSTNLSLSDKLRQNIHNSFERMVLDNSSEQDTDRATSRHKQTIMAPPMQQNGSLTPPEDSFLPHETKSSAVLHRSLHEQPHRVTAGSGLYLHLSNGQRIIDATGGAAVACLGHGHPAIKAAIVDQLDEVAYAHSLFYSTSAAEELAAELVAGTGGKMTRAFIVSSGSEAMEAAMKMARQYFVEIEGKQSKRVAFIARKMSYHGTTLGSLGLGGHLARREIYEGMLSTHISHVSPCFEYRGLNEGEAVSEYVSRLKTELDAEFQRLGPETVCAFVAEPVVGAALGCVPSVQGYFAAMREVCDKYGALLILDEVMSGMGRCGYLHAWQSPLVDISPDIQTIGKGLGGGYAPVAAMLVNKRVVDVLERGTGSFSHGQTYQGHPIACAAALAVQTTIRTEGLVEKARRSGTLLEKSLKEGLSGHEHVGDIRGMGLFWGIEFVKDKRTKEPFDPSLQVAMGIHNLGMQEPYSISLYPGSGTVEGKRGDHVLLAPPYTSSDAEIKLISDTTVRVIEAFFGQNLALFEQDPDHKVVT